MWLSKRGFACVDFLFVGFWHAAGESTAAVAFCRAAHDDEVPGHCRPRLRVPAPGAQACGARRLVGLAGGIAGRLLWLGGGLVWDQGLAAALAAQPVSFPNLVCA